MKTDYIPHYPQKGFSATVQFRGTKEELQTLYNLLYKTEPADSEEHRIIDDVMNEVSEAVNWLADMEDIAERINSSETDPVKFKNASQSGATAEELKEIIQRLGEIAAHVND